MHFGVKKSENVAGVNKKTNIMYGTTEMIFELRREWFQKIRIQNGWHEHEHDGLWMIWELIREWFQKTGNQNGWHEGWYNDEEEVIFHKVGKATPQPAIAVRKADQGTNRRKFLKNPLTPSASFSYPSSYLKFLFLHKLFHILFSNCAAFDRLKDHWQKFGAGPEKGKWLWHWGG